MSPVRKELNEYSLALDLAVGAMPQVEIARRHGVSRSLVCKIARGRKRPHIAQWIAEWQRELKNHTRLQILSLQKEAVRTFGRAMGEKEPINTALAAAKELLNRTLGNDWSAEGTEEPAPPLPRSFMDLTPETKRLVLQEFGGPLE